MRLKNINTSLMLVSGILVAIYSYIYSYALLFTVKTMLISMLIFYVIGTIMQKLLKGIVDREAQEQSPQIDDEEQNMDYSTSEPEQEDK